MSYSLGLLVICVIAMVTASPVKEEEKNILEKRETSCRYPTECPWRGQCKPIGEPFPTDEKCGRQFCRGLPGGGWAYYSIPDCEDYRGNCVGQGSRFDMFGDDGHLRTGCVCFCGNGLHC